MTCGLHYQAVITTLILTWKGSFNSTLTYTFPLLFSMLAFLNSILLIARYPLLHELIHYWQIWLTRVDFVLRGVRRGEKSCISWLMSSCQPLRNGNVALVRLFPSPISPVQPDWLDMAQCSSLFPSLCRLARLKPVRPVLQQQHDCFLSVSTLCSPGLLLASLSRNHWCVTNFQRA